MNEPIYNVFAFVKGDDITEFGCTIHHHRGSDDEKVEYLRANVSRDYRLTRRFPIQPINVDKFLAVQRAGRVMDVIEPLLAKLECKTRTPMLVLTFIVDGKPRIDEVVKV